MFDVLFKFRKWSRCEITTAGQKGMRHDFPEYCTCWRCFQNIDIFFLLSEKDLNKVVSCFLSKWTMSSEYYEWLYEFLYDRNSYHRKCKKDYKMFWRPPQITLAHGTLCWWLGAFGLFLCWLHPSGQFVCTQWVSWNIEQIFQTLTIRMLKNKSRFTLKWGSPCSKFTLGLDFDERRKNIFDLILN